MSLEDLGRVVAKQQDERLERSDAVERVRDRIAATPLSRKPNVARVAWLAAAALAVALVVFAFARMRSPAPLSFSIGGESATSGDWISAERTGVTAVRFSDGSFFAFRDDARARVESVNADGAHIVMERGTVSADVIHRATSHWSVLAGPYEVRVTGTQFEVTWDPGAARLDVHVTRGSVRVSGGAIAPHDVTTGQALTIPEQTAAIAPTVSDVIRAPESDLSARELATTTPKTTPKWRELAAAGNYVGAMDEAERTGIDNVIAGSGPADLIALADAARFSGRPEVAQKSLLALRRRFPKDAHAARAAFDLGRVAFDQQHDYGAAATWFETSAKEDASGTFAREAAGRLIESRQRAGDTAGAIVAAREYLARYPDGPHARLAKSLIRE